MTERWDKLRQYTFEWPQLDVVFLLALTRWLLVAVVIAALVWLAAATLRRRRAPLRPATEERVGRRRFGHRGTEPQTRSPA
jgi:heme exporter protein D